MYPSPPAHTPLPQMKFQQTTQCCSNHSPFWHKHCISGLINGWRSWHHSCCLWVSSWNWKCFQICQSGTGDSLLEHSQEHHRCVEWFWFSTFWRNLPTHDNGSQIHSEKTLILPDCPPPLIILLENLEWQNKSDVDLWKHAYLATQSSQNNQNWPEFDPQIVGTPPLLATPPVTL